VIDPMCARLDRTGRWRHHHDEDSPDSDADTASMGHIMHQWRSFARDTLVVWRLDRLGRSTAHVIQMVTELGERRVGGHCRSSEAIDTSTSGRLLFGYSPACARSSEI
jgi:Resolvase, N terminal domain